MGCDIHVRASKLNKETNLYEELILWRPGVEYHYAHNDATGEMEKIVDNPDFEKVYIYNGRNYEMFDGMKDGTEEDGYGNFPHFPIVLNSLEPAFRENIKEYMEATGFFDFWEISLAEMKLYLLEHPKVLDYYNCEEDEDVWKDNPIKDLFQDICNYINYADKEWDWTPLSQYKIIIYFDW